MPAQKASSTWYCLSGHIWQQRVKPCLLGTRPFFHSWNCRWVTWNTHKISMLTLDFHGCSIHGFWLPSFSRSQNWTSWRRMAQAGGWVMAVDHRIWWRTHWSPGEGAEINNGNIDLSPSCSLILKECLQPLRDAWKNVGPCRLWLFRADGNLSPSLLWNVNVQEIREKASD